MVKVHCRRVKHGKYVVKNSKGVTVFGSIRQGKTTVKSLRQIHFLHFKKIDHTHFSCRGRSVRKTRHVYR